MRPLVSLVFLLTLATVSAALAAPSPVPMPLWPNGAPGALGTAEKDIPTLTAFLPSPEKATGAAFIVCPGGGYLKLADYEGAGYAQWLADQGIAGFVLKYRLASDGYHHPAMLEDAARAMRLVRSKAAEWHLDADRIGMMGSSAGGHLTSMMVTHFDAGKPDDPDPVERQSSRPDLGVLCYAVITLGEFGNAGTRTALLGDNPAPETLKDLSSELQVRTDTPPCFIWHFYEDKSVKVENPLLMATALRAKNVPFELHIYEKGKHGVGLGNSGKPGPVHRWTTDLSAWLGERGWLAKK